MGFFGTIIDALFNSEEYSDLGKAGERYTYRELEAIYKKNLIIRNVYLKKQNGEYTEIDLILVYSTGIFVIESKNYSGWIFGNDSHAQWTQVLSGGKKTKFYNPVWQNNTHIKSLKNVLKKYPNIKYYSIIVFSERCTLKDVTCTSQDTYVIKRNQLQDLLEYIEQENTDTINKQDRYDIADFLSNYSRPKQEIQEQHIREVQKNLTKCPVCKNTLIERANKETKEKFYGCSNFPKCRYSKPIDEPTN